MKELRPHQAKAIEMLRASLRSGKRRPILQLCTGAGKTVIAANIIRSAVGKGKRVLFLVDAISLIDQTVQAFYAEELYSIGVIQAQHPMTDYSRQIQVASVQTLARRDCPPFDLAIVDEAHCRYASVQSLMASRDVPFIGLSATPWAKGLGNDYDDLLQPATMRELTEAGFILPLVAYAPSHPDLSNVKVQAGEYREDQLSEVMRGEKLIADVVETWKALGENRPTFCFCVDRAHAKAMQERFQRAGIGCGYIDGETSGADRLAVKRELDEGEIRVVCSVGALIKGVDWIVSCAISAAPTKSPMRWVQSIGRALRVNPPWTEAILLDHSDNALRLGLPVDIHRDQLCCAQKGDRQEAGEAEAKALPKGCPRCSALKEPGVKKCPKCGFEQQQLGADLGEAAGSLARIDGKAQGKGPKKPEWTAESKERAYRELLGWCIKHKKPERQASGKYRDRFGVWPARKAGLTPLPPSLDTEAWVRASNIRYAKRAQRNQVRS